MNNLTTESSLDELSLLRLFSCGLNNSKKPVPFPITVQNYINIDMNIYDKTARVGWLSDTLWVHVIATH